MQIAKYDNKTQLSTSFVPFKLWQRLLKQYNPREFILRWIHCGGAHPPAHVVIFLGGVGVCVYVCERGVCVWVQEVANNSCQMCRVPRAHAHSHRQWNACEEPQQEVRSGLLTPPLKA